MFPCCRVRRHPVFVEVLALARIDLGMAGKRALPVIIDPLPAVKSATAHIPELGINHRFVTDSTVFDIGFAHDAHPSSLRRFPYAAADSWTDVAEWLTSRDHFLNSAAATVAAGKSCRNPGCGHLWISVYTRRLGLKQAT